MNYPLQFTICSWLVVHYIDSLLRLFCWLELTDLLLLSSGDPLPFSMWICYVCVFSTLKYFEWSRLKCFSLKEKGQKHKLYHRTDMDSNLALPWISDMVLINYLLFYVT